MQLSLEKIVTNDYMEKKLDELRNYEIYIYGAGSFGKEMYYFLEERGIKIEAFLDQRASEIKTYCEHLVYHPDADFRGKDSEKFLLLFAIVMDKQERKKIISSLKNKGFNHIEEAQFYRSLQIVPEGAADIELRNYYLKNQDRINKAYSLLNDEKSRSIYSCNIKAHFLKDFKACEQLEDAMTEQYFPKDISFAKGYQRFVDCGGFVGDTVECLLNNKAEVQSVVTFEPDTDNFKFLTENQEKNNCQVICFPCAVSDCTSFQKFSTARGSGALCDDGDTTILTVSLDEALHNYEPTFIKMDIEGAELKGIYGAKKLIYRSVPDLAICVYHKINHIWDIILLLDSFNLGYKYYLRSYNAYTMETVLYATIGEK